MSGLTRSEIDAIIKGLYMEYYRNRIPVPRVEPAELEYWWGRWESADDE